MLELYPDTQEKLNVEPRVIKTMDVVLDFEYPVPFIILQNYGIGKKFVTRLSLRFELQKGDAFDYIKLKQFSVNETELIEKMIARIIPVKFKVDELIEAHILRKFLIKSYQGICHAHGKPVRGQRTRTN